VETSINQQSRPSSAVLTAWTPEPFFPRPWLRGGHRQTLAAALLPRRFSLPQARERLFEVEPGIRVLCHCNWQDNSHAAFTLLIVHGFEGSSHSRYVLGTADKAWTAGMNVVRMNIRNCGGTELLGPTLYHSGLSADVGAVARELLEGDGLPRLGIAGFSLGGNQVLKLAGELGHGAPSGLCAVAAVCPSLDLIDSSHALHRWRNRLYEWNFLRSVRRTLSRKLAAYPAVCPPGSARWYQSIRDFDHRVTAPHFGFASADDYYMRASASRLLPQIAIPGLILHSADDPFVVLTEQTRRHIGENHRLIFFETHHGGHCGFVGKPRGYDGFWAERQVVEFFCQFRLH
jgi:predicted alpha/beta-fold hydrolase